MAHPDLPLEWHDHLDNPLLEPPFPEFIIADPTVLTPDVSPDGAWHLFAHGIILGIHHYTSTDGVSWRRIGRVAWGMRPRVLVDEGYHLFFERFVTPLRSEIRVVSSSDLTSWSAPTTVLAPSLPWEGGLAKTCGNPCPVKVDGEYRLYYSANLVWLHDCGFPEPKFVSVATSPHLLGPYQKRKVPLIEPTHAVPHRNYGAGALRVVHEPSKDRFLGFTNGIFIDDDGHSRSDIRLLVSEDGYQWDEVSKGPLVAPEPGWKEALVYALDVVPWRGELFMYFNARSGWRVGVERIGLATCRYELG